MDISFYIANFLCEQMLVESIPQENTDFFETEQPFDHKELMLLIQECQETSHQQPHIVLCALIYLGRMQKAGFQLTSWNVARVFIVLVIISSKFHDDCCFKTASWQDFFQDDSLGRLEPVIYLKWLQCDLWVEWSEVMQLYDLLLG